MKTTYRLTDPDIAEATLTLTMKVSEWKRLKDQLISDYPSWQLRSAILKLLDQAHAYFEAEQEHMP